MLISRSSNDPDIVVYERLVVLVGGVGKENCDQSKYSLTDT